MNKRQELIMAWKNVIELDIENTDIVFRKKFADLFSLRTFLLDCIVDPGYSLPIELSEFIFLSSSGEKYLSMLKEVADKYSTSQIKIALFLIFYHHELTIDLDKTNFTKIFNVIHKEVFDGNLKFPWVYDRILYDRFFDLFPDRTKRLSSEETLQLLKDTPQGVFQLKNVIVGPFGLLKSTYERYLPPTRQAPLWHCSDPSCDAIHTVKMETSNTDTASLKSLIFDFLTKKIKDFSEWNLFYLRCLDRRNYYDDWCPDGIPWLIANTFSDEEIRGILTALFKTKYKEIKSSFPHLGYVRNIINDSPEKIVASLSKPQCFQIILVFSDEVLVNTIETLIEEKIIKIPSMELRIPKYSRSYSGWFNTFWQCSPFGFRAVSRNSEISIAKLKRLIKQIYPESDKSHELEWKLRHVEGETLCMKLDNFLYQEDPKQIIRDLILSSQLRLQEAFKQLSYGKFNMPGSSDDENYLINKILWKLGFEINVYPQVQEYFWRRKDAFLEVARTFSNYSESNKETIRSAGSNFFVSLEEILDLSLSFIAWVLLEDHYGSTKFICDFDIARRFMSLKLSGRKIPGEMPGSRINFNGEGINTLYPLLKGFKILACLCREILTSNDKNNCRPTQEFPGYFNKTDLQLFPFVHKIMLLDINKEDREKILSALENVTSTLEYSNISNIRNRMQHNRKAQEFPIQTEIEKACEAVSNIVIKMEESGICPLLYLFSSNLTDQYKRSILKLKDYRGREVAFHIPSPFTAADIPTFIRPVIVIPWIHIGETAEMLRFYYQENSDYVNIWQGYPKRKPRVKQNAGNIIHTEDVN
jgi:hypothetical protein